MSVLIGKEILKALKNKSIAIDPLDKSQIEPGSVDLTSASISGSSKNGRKSTT